MAEHPTGVIKRVLKLQGPTPRYVAVTDEYQRIWPTASIVEVQHPTFDQRQRGVVPVELVDGKPPASKKKRAKKKVSKVTPTDDGDLSGGLDDSALAGEVTGGDDS